MKNRPVCCLPVSCLDMELTSQFYCRYMSILESGQLEESPKARQIMRAAEELFTTRRFHEITMDDVCHLAGVGKGTIYRYFRDKDDLFVRSATLGLDELCVVLKDKSRQGGDFEHRLLDGCREISRYFRSRRHMFHMMHVQDMCQGGALRARWAPRRKALIEALSEILAGGADEGKLSGDVSLPVLANLLLGLLRAAAKDLGDAPEHCKQPEFIVRFFLHGAAGVESHKERP